MNHRKALVLAWAVLQRERGKAISPIASNCRAYVRMDAFAAYKMKVGPTKVTTQFNIRNLLDKNYYESTDPDSNIAASLGIAPGAPLTAIGSIRVEY